MRLVMHMKISDLFTVQCSIIHNLIHNFIDDLLERKKKLKSGEVEHLSFMKKIFGDKKVKRADLKSGLTQLVEILHHRCSSLNISILEYIFAF
jgi:uncharacterized protein VirK/YbjX